MSFQLFAMIFRQVIDIAGQVWLQVLLILSEHACALCV